MGDIAQSRFEGAIWHKHVEKHNLLMAGAGATGSYCAFFFARTGIKKVTIVDFDFIEPHNSFSQLFPIESIGETKARALRDVLYRFTPTVDVNAYNGPIENVRQGEFAVANVILSMTDSMSARKWMFDKAVSVHANDEAAERRPRIFFDSRITAEYWEVYAVPLDNEEKIAAYKDTLFSDEEGEVGACNYQQSSHSACGAALKIVELYTNWVTNILMEEDDLPFKVSCDIRTQKYEYVY